MSFVFSLSPPRYLFLEPIGFGKKSVGSFVACSSLHITIYWHFLREKESKQTDWSTRRVSIERGSCNAKSESSFFFYNASFFIKENRFSIKSLLLPFELERSRLNSDHFFLIFLEITSLNPPNAAQKTQKTRWLPDQFIFNLALLLVAKKNAFFKLLISQRRNIKSWKIGVPL